jgi:hypothetical protein
LSASLTPNDPNAQALGQIIDKLSRVPDVLRRFSVSSEWAVAAAGLPSELLQRLVAGGMPWVGEPADPLFDAGDLTTVSLALGLNSTRRDAMVFWIRTLDRVRRGRVTHETRYVADCQAPGHSGPCQWRLHLPSLLSVELFTPPVGLDEPLTVASDEPASRAPAHIRRILRKYDDVSFHLLPMAARWDLDLVRRRRIAECSAVARVVVADALETGVPARLSFGLIVAPPYSTTHCWPEFEVGDRWIPYDPLMLRSLRAWGIPGAQSLHPMTSPAGLYHRLGPCLEPIVTHAGRACPVSLPTRVIAS